MNEDNEFFIQMRGCRDAYRRLGDDIHAVLGRNNAVDFGCGVADQDERLVEIGWFVLGLDPSPDARALAKIDTAHFDFTDADNVAALMQVAKLSDVAICTETAEHIPAEHERTIVRCVSQCAEKWMRSRRPHCDKRCWSGMRSTSMRGATS